jgi:hypothetical protein
MQDEVVCLQERGGQVFIGDWRRSEYEVFAAFRLPIGTTTSGFKPDSVGYAVGQAEFIRWIPLAPRRTGALVAGVEWQSDTACRCSGTACRSTLPAVRL